jgi:hypothetical protein
MYKRIFRDLMPAFAGLLIIFASFGISTNPLAGVWQQKPQKRIKTDVFTQPAREPVIVTGVKLGAREVNLNAPFDDEDDEWIRNLSFKLKNHSKRNVIFIGVNLFIPAETTSSIPGMVQQFRFGQEPNSPDSTNSPILIKPGDAIDVSIPAPKYKSIKQFIDATQPQRKIDSVMVKVYLVLFEDGMSWAGGDFYLPDSTQPFGLRKIDPPDGIIRKDTLLQD